MNTYAYRLADLAPDLAEGVVAAWHAAPGAQIAEGDDLLDVVTDKACITIPAPAGGRIICQHVAPDARVRADDLVVTLDKD